MGAILAEELGGDLDVVLVKKIGAPGNSELAIGAVTESGRIYRSEEADELGVSDEYLEEEGERLQKTLHRRRREYTGERPRIDLKDRTVIVVDDGIATGATMYAAVQSIQAEEPERVVVAAGIGSTRSVRELETVADEVVCLEQPGILYGISQGYERFPQVGDDRVAELLESARNQTPSPHE